MQMQVDFDFMVEKAKHWEHVDGSLWWRNPQTQQIEPYHEDAGGDSVEEKPQNKASKATFKNFATIAVKWISGTEPFFSEFSKSRKNYKDITSGVNGSLLCNFDKCSGVFKPIDLETKSKDVRKTVDIRTTPQAFREVAAYKVSELLGLDVVPPTTMRVQTVARFEDAVNEKALAGSCQLFVKGKNASEVTSALKKMKHKITPKFKQEFLKLQLLDIITCNTDRHGGNFMIDLKNERVYGIDNGLSFPNSEIEKRTEDILTDLTFYTIKQYKEWHPDMGAYEELSVADAKLFDRDVRDKVLKVTKEQFMSIFDGTTFNDLEKYGAYERLQHVQQVFKALSDGEDTDVEHHINTAVNEEINNRKQQAADEAAGELFPNPTDVRNAEIDNMRSRIREGLFPKKKKEGV